MLRQSKETSRRTARAAKPSSSDAATLDAAIPTAYNAIHPRGTAIAAVERRAAALDPPNLIRLTPA
ncbi:hypothetical protein SPHINGO361_100049 [Sphingomonas sp. EC-HK361]|nr:hypothetical protein SPHINGO361_100049 [Sphingomonas sp. EC-HK361]